MSGIQRSSTPRSGARMCHGTMLAWCSISVSTITSPSWRLARAQLYATRLIASVTFLVNTISLVSPPSRRATLARGTFVGVRGLLGDRVHAAVHVRVRLAVHTVHRVEHGLRLLRRRRRVEVHEPLAVHLALQDREVGLDAGDVERAHAAARNASKPDRSSSSTSSVPPEATTRPSRRMWIRSGVRYSRILR